MSKQWATNWKTLSSPTGSGPLHSLADCLARPEQFLRGADATKAIKIDGQARDGLFRDERISLGDLVHTHWPLCSSHIRLISERATVMSVWNNIMLALDRKLGRAFHEWRVTKYFFHDVERHLKRPADTRGNLYTSDHCDEFAMTRAIDLSLNWAAWRAHRQSLTVSISDTIAPVSIPSPLSISQTVATLPLTSPQFKSADEVRRELELIEMRERALAAAVAKTENELKAVSIAEQPTVDDNAAANQPMESPLKSDEPEIASSSSTAGTNAESIVDPGTEQTDPSQLIELVEQHEAEAAAARALLQSQQFELEIQREQLTMMKEAAEHEQNEARQAEERLKQLKAMLADM